MSLWMLRGLVGDAVTLSPSLLNPVGSERQAAAEDGVDALLAIITRSVSIYSPNLCRAPTMCQRIQQ